MNVQPEREGRYITDEGENPERYRLMLLCKCLTCGGSGKGIGRVWSKATHERVVERCSDCRGEGFTLQEAATCATKEAVGVALVTLALEDMWKDENGDPCGFGLIDSEGEKGKRWLVSPFRASARNVSDAARTLARSKRTADSQ
jgi:hypothetical protein